jgi:hypothetical protein
MYLEDPIRPSKSLELSIPILAMNEKFWSISYIEHIIEKASFF